MSVTTGARTLIDKALSRTFGSSPDSRWFLYLKDRQVRAFNLHDGTVVTLDASLLPGRTYVNTEDDHAYELPIWGVAGWTKDGRSVLLYDKYDVWKVPLDGGKATDLTAGVGRSSRSSSVLCGWVKNIKTPFMIMQGGADGAVDYVDGLQFFNAARRVFCARGEDGACALG